MPRPTPTLIPELKVVDFKKSIDFYTNLAQFKIEYDRPSRNSPCSTGTAHGL